MANIDYTFWALRLAIFNKRFIEKSPRTLVTTPMLSPTC